MRVANWPATYLMVTATLLAGCGDDKSPSGDDDSPSETSTSGDATDTGGPQGLWEFEDVLGTANRDDDDESGKSDWLEAPYETDDDLVTWTMPAAAFVGFGEGDSVELRLAGALESVRIWRGKTPVLGHDATELHERYTFTPSGDDEPFVVEFNDYGHASTLTIDHLDAGGTVIETATIELRAAPLIMNHHLQPAEHVWAVAVNSNGAFIDAYQTHLGDRFSAVPGGSVGGDVWIQDEIEFATGTSPGHRINIIIDSIRDRGLDDFPDQIVQPNIFKQTWGAGNPSSMDSFGNLEATPPITVDGVEYPFGRIYFGKTPVDGINDILSTFLESQAIQAPVRFDTTWLCVGHVDEFSSFVPDPSSPKGFKALLADIDAAYALFETLDPDMALPRYANTHGYATVGEILDDTALRAVNEDVRDDYLLPIREQFKTEFGLDDSDIIAIPTLFEEIGGCGGSVAALMPGMVNLIVANFEGETPKLFVPDPFFRTDLDDQSGDPLLAAFADAMPDGVETIFIDNWYTYHMALGEVHCGTNVMRTPIANWWEVGTHLLD
jgi:protein-arginine deiminase